MFELLMLDVRTLAFTTSVSGLLMAATMAGIYAAGMRSRALIDWSIAGLLSALGYLTGHTLQTLDLPVSPWIGGTVANGLITLSYGMVLVGVQRYLNMRPMIWLALLVTLATFASSFVFPELRTSLRLRIIFHSWPYVLFSAWAGVLLWRRVRPGMRRFHRMVAGVLLLNATYLSLRLVHAIVSPALTTSFVQNPMQMAAFLVAMVFGFCLTMALAVMMFREKQVELLDLAEKDPLTGLNNRHSLDHVAARQVRRAQEQDADLSVIVLDVDHFKPINDRYGHQAGDDALVAIARRIRRVLRDSDVAFRIGGEEFLVLLPGATEAQAARVAERLRSSISERPIEIDNGSIAVTASLGVAVVQVSEEGWEEGFRRADQALYRAKAAGRDQVAASS
jgi:diguanylate cyclase (GGDEF)-like protein